MKRWPPAVHSLIPAIAVVVGASLLAQLPSERGGTEPILIAGTPSNAISIRNYIADHRKTGINPFSSQSIADSRGRIIAFTIAGLDDVAGQRCELRWAELDLEDLRPATAGTWRYDNFLGWPDGLVFPTADTSEFQGEIWVPEPNAVPDAGHEFLIRLRLLCQGREITREDTASFLAPLLPRSPGVPVRAPPGSAGSPSQFARPPMTMPPGGPEQEP